MIMGLSYYDNRSDLHKLFQCEDRLSLYKCFKSLLFGLFLRCDIGYSIGVSIHHIVGAQ